MYAKRLCQQTLTSPGYCWYNNDASTYKDTYGALYNWYTANNSKLCPIGWHVPTDTEWAILTDYLGGPDMAGGKMKEIGISHWESPNTGATNESGFTALPGGFRNLLGTFNDVKRNGTWHSATEIRDTIHVEPRPYKHSWSRVVYFDANIVGRGDNYITGGFSIRCIKDN